MNLQSLLLSSDDRTTRALRRVLGELEIDVQHCKDTDSAIRALTRGRFDAVITDCDENIGAHILTSLRLAPGNKHAVAVAIVDSQSEVQRASLEEADLVLYKPVPFELAKRRFRAARYLMKCHRRRNTRVMVEFPVTFLSGSGKVEHRAVTSDISEHGMAVRLPRRFKTGDPTWVRFTLPGTDHIVECTAELAWQNSRYEAGLRFLELSAEDRENLKAWLDPYCFAFLPAEALPIGANLMPPAHPTCAPATE